ncbi:metallophosphoesterase family protein [Niveispirillum sp.]|uniref:metallophosphoesterase family protein n=1 Tax=Niveispirillum sp. TaxID=1917217 RepID=UPI001B43743D|nr:metallophosphoesterase family protein [Niveispirillum sp.]MBP7337111.1 metallophosphoesterase family protein [Niveispirillum sp.]
MLVGLVSDIHGNAAALAHAFDLLRDAGMLICLGDSISQHRFCNDTVRLLRDREVLTIQGNHEAAFFAPAARQGRMKNGIDGTLMDWLAQRPVRLDRMIGGRRILMIHSTALDPLGDYVAGEGARFHQHFEGTGADIILCGHTHMPGIRRTAGGTLVVNPGSAGEGRPVGDGFIASCALLDISTADIQFFEFTH